MGDCRRVPRQRLHHCCGVPLVNRKVQIVRFWLLAIFAVAWAVLCRDPMWAIAPVAFFTGQAGCFCCAGAACSACTSTPTQMEMVIINLTTGTGPGECANCAALNGTYVLTQTVSAPCVYEYVLDPDVCTYGSLFVSLAVNGFVVAYTDDLLPNSLRWQATVPAQPTTWDCSAVSNLSMSFNFLSGSIVKCQPGTDPGGCIVSAL